MNVQAISEVIATQSVEFAHELSTLVNRQVETLSAIETPSNEVTETLAICREVLAICENRINTTTTATSCLNQVISAPSVEFVHELSTLVNRCVEALSTIATPSNEVVETLALNNEVLAICETRIATAHAHVISCATAHAHATETATETAE